MLLQPMHACCPSQTGHALPSPALSCTVASHPWACPHAASVHSHQTLRRELQLTARGERFPLRSGCHWAARSGHAFAKGERSAAATGCQTLGTPGIQSNFVALQGVNNMMVLMTAMFWS